MPIGKDIEKYVYILGAGFSAPLGIPMMSNFMEKAKDQFSNEPQKYSHFANIFDKINSLHECAYHYDCDIGNIEEILSILLTQDNINNSNNAELFRTFIKDVIEYYTPSSDKIDILRKKNYIDNRNRKATIEVTHFSPYAQFVIHLFNFQFIRDFRQVPITINRPGSNKSLVHDNQFELLKAVSRKESKQNYSVITLNYDLILETALNNINRRLNEKFTFCIDKEPDYARPCLAKIHGCISKPESIIPPTWNKGELTDYTQNAWSLAGKLLQNAHHVRIIGYSLPETDSYIKYLLKAACISTKGTYTNLKSIKVYDLNASTTDKYSKFMKNFNSKKDLFLVNIKNVLNRIIYYDNRNDKYTSKPLEEATTEAMAPPSRPISSVEQAIRKIIEEEEREKNIRNNLIY
jgi:hypothetical protein